MRIQFNNDEYAKTPRWAGMYRETVDGKTYVSVDTNSTKGTFDVKDANNVSGMKGDNYPYLFTQDGDEVVLEITNSTNPVSIHLHDTICKRT